MALSGCCSLKEVAVGRPRKDASAQDVRERLIAAMVDRLIREPVNAVTVASLIREAGCNRSTFYYHFSGIEQLAEKALDAVVPVEIPRALLMFAQQGTSLGEGESEGGADPFNGEGAAEGEIASSRSAFPDATSIPELVKRSSRDIDMLCAVLNGPNAVLAQRRVKRRLLEDVLPTLGDSLFLCADDPKFRIVFEYASGGVLALMAYRAETGFFYPVETFLQCLAPEIPAALIDVLSKKG